MRNRQLYTALLMVLCLGWIVADTLTTKREFEGKIVVEVFRKRQNTGIWVSIDKLNVPNAKFPCEFSGLNYKNEFTVNTKYDFVGISDTGNRMIVRMKEPATVHYNPTNGMATMDVTLNFEMNRAKTPLPLKFTTESIQNSGKEERGQRVKQESTQGVFSLALVGGGTITTREQEDPNSMLGQQSIMALVEMLIVVHGEGQIRTKS